MSVVFNSLGGRHTDRHTNTHTHPHENDIKKLGVPATGRRAPGLKRRKIRKLLPNHLIEYIAKATVATCMCVSG